MPKNIHKDTHSSKHSYADAFNSLKEVWASALLFGAVFFFLSLFTCNKADLTAYTTLGIFHPPGNFFGIIGAWTAQKLYYSVGFASFVIPFSLATWAIRSFFVGFAFGWIRFYLKTILFIISLISASILLMLYQETIPPSIFKMNPTPYAGGIVGFFITDKFALTYLGIYGSRVISAFSFMLSLLFISEGRPFKYIKWFFERIFLLFKTVFSAIDAWIEYMRTAREDNEKQPKTTGKKNVIQESSSLNPLQPPISEPTSKTAHFSPPPEPTIVRHHDESSDFKPAKEKDSGTEYELPPIDLLEQVKQPKESAVEDSLKQCAMTLQKTLAEFGIEVTISDITRGPVITRYELTLSPGTKVQRITTLTDDIALAMKTPHIRIIAPIPGKSAIGIEVPNEVKTLVTLRDILCSKEFINNKLVLPLVLGKDIAGKPIITDLNAAPHLLIAGATGSGKSVCINAFIMSLLYHASPARLKFLMVDPKKVELTLYNKLPHLLSPVITDAKKVSGGLNWVVREMDQRYQILSDAGVRNIKAFNALPDEKRLRFFNEKHFEDGYMPYIVVILDELADLMMVAQDDIEDAIARLAQLSRAVGIHLILATQRPSVNVITGVIKANFPVRISFKVSSKVDSRTVLDANGAEALLGNGDFLFLPPGTSKLIRGQGAYVSDKEIHRVVDYIHDQTDQKTEPFDILEQEELFSPVSDEMDDELYEQAVDIVKLSGQASSSILQRKLRVGYARAARLIDMMEANGIVGPHRGSKPRDILIE